MACRNQRCNREGKVESRGARREERRAPLDDDVTRCEWRPGRVDLFKYSRYKRNVRPERETKAMTDTTYDPESDAVYITVGRGRVARTKKNGRFVYDLDAEGHIVGIEILSASKMLAPGDWQKARRPAANPRERPQVAERHRGFIFIKRFSPSDAESR